jgi:hypothetical protein
MLTNRRGLVIRNSIIYYGYTQALSNLPKGPTKEELQAEKWKKMIEVKPGRPDDWVSPLLVGLACDEDNERSVLEVLCNYRKERMCFGYQLDPVEIEWCTPHTGGGRFDPAISNKTARKGGLFIN